MSADSVTRFQKPSKLWEVLTEFLGSMTMIMLASQAPSIWSWGISYLVVSTVLSGTHLNSWITFYKMVTGSMDAVLAVMLFGAQFLGAFVAFHLSEWVNMSQDTLPNSGWAITDWKAG